MITKSKINFKITNIEFLNDVKLPFVKINNEFAKKLEKHQNFEFVKFAAKEEIDKSEIENKIGLLHFPADFNLKKDMEEHPDNLYIKALAIVADEPNDNGDFFTEKELKKAFSTFVGCPLFVNHKNDDVEEARGTIIFAKWSDEEHGIIIIGRVDAKAYPKLARGISEGYITGVSMGCTVEYSECSICHNQASKEEDYCVHIKEHKTRMFKGKKVYEINFNIKFIELSFVVDPACEQCHVQEIFDISDLKEKIGKLSDFTNHFRKAASKYAGKEEVDKLNQAETLLQEVAKKMLDQKDHLELTYVTDLVEALSKLQETKDELVDMGYEQLPSNPSAAGTAPTSQPSAAPVSTEKGQNMEEQNINTTGINATPAGEVGTVTMPTPLANNFKKKLNKKAMIFSQIAKDKFKKQME